MKKKPNLAVPINSSRMSLLQKIVERTDMKNIKLLQKEKISFHNEIKQKGGLIKWAKSQSQYRKILNKANPGRYKNSVNKVVPLKKDSTTNLTKATKSNAGLLMKKSKIDKIKIDKI